MRIQNVERGPIARVAGAIGAIAVIVLAATLGIAVLAVMLGLALIGAVVIAVRVWWLRRQLRRAAAEARQQRSGSSYTGHVIEGEIVRERTDREPPQR
ncbi:MAG: hypothetical protein ACLFSI_08200 [Halorhodospira sp.]